MEKLFLNDQYRIPHLKSTNAMDYGKQTIDHGYKEYSSLVKFEVGFRVLDLVFSNTEVQLL